MTEKLDYDQQHNADALAALGVEYPIQKRYIVTESQLAAIGEALSDAQGFYEVFQGWEGTEEREANLVKIDALGWPTELVGGCEHWHRTCKVCGVFPVLEGWLAGEEYYCHPCGEACTTETYTDDAGVKHTGLSVPEACRLTWIDYPDCDFFYWTQWELSDGDCFEDGPCYCHCWLCTKYKAANGS